MKETTKKMYIVTQTGKKLPVDTSNLSKEEYMSFQQNVALYSDDTILKPIWYVQGQRTKKGSYFTINNEYDLVAEKIYNHNPTKEELLYFMSANGLSRFDIVTIDQGYELDIK